MQNDNTTATNVTWQHKYRNPVAVLFLPLITMGIYYFVWLVNTKDELNDEGAGIPTAWYLIVPLLNVYWLYLYARGVERVTNGKYSVLPTFILLWLTHSIGMAIVQNWFNEYWGLKKDSGF